MKKEFDVKIRKASEEDIPSVYRFGKSVHELGFSSKFPFHQRSELYEAVENSSRNVLLIAEVDNEIVGFVFGIIILTRAGGWCMLDNLAVGKEFRNHGIAENLLDEFYKIIKKKKVRYVQILEQDERKKTRDFWKKRGFKETKKFIWAERKI